MNNTNEQRSFGSDFRIYEYCAHLFKKVTAVTVVTGKAVYIKIIVTTVTGVT